MSAIAGPAVGTAENVAANVDVDAYADAGPADAAALDKNEHDKLGAADADVGPAPAFTSAVDVRSDADADVDARPTPTYRQWPSVNSRP